ncbi:L-ectoine synthase [Collibacillus ludicampi]|uniref:L-ectoine synthase n=1 Tax=Collibacillus ludicampi TaxID=2771369 RepID=A0AAV4LDA8_9BACL|nr:ectoine synthase [Collibacillus ludicampi]GIM45805.1 L-ectoine synthase [Collibacillus ludicampi]
MIVRTLEEIIDTENNVVADTWNSRRFLLKKDGVGFSLHDTIMRAGTETTMWYKNHIEAVYCIEGEGELEDLSNGRVYSLKPGTLYTLNGHEKHRVRSKTDLRMICVFNPPCTGREVHNQDGAYPLVEEEL